MPDLAVGQNRFGIPFGWYVNSPPILEPILVVGLVDVHGGYDFDFDPWPSDHVSFGHTGIWILGGKEHTL